MNYLKSVTFICGIITGLFAFTQKIVTKEFSREFALQFKNFDLLLWIKSWPKVSKDAFDSIFGENHLTWKCFFRSCISSFSFLLIVTSAYFFLQPEDTIINYLKGIIRTLSKTDSPYSSLIFGHNIYYIIMMGVLIISMNLLIDYLSLIETRVVLSKISRTDRVYTIFVFLILDIIFTALIFFFLGYLIYILSFVLVYFLGNFVGKNLIDLAPNKTLSDFLWHLTKTWWTINIVKLNTTLPAPYNISGLERCSYWVYYTTFMTSFWIWCFAFSSIIYKVTEKFLGPFWDFLKVRFLNIDEQPFMVLAWLSGAIIIVLSIVIYPFF